MATLKFIIKSRDLGITKKKTKKGETVKVFDEKKRNKPALIFAQYTHKIGKTYSSVLFSTGKRIEPKYWNEEAGKYIKHENSVKLNKVLKEFDEEIQEIVTDLQSKKLEPIPVEVKEAYKKAKIEKLPEAELTRSIIFQWRDYLNSRKNSIKSLTYSNQRNSIEALEAWLKSEKIEGLRPEQFSVKHLTKWQDYLNKKYSGNTVAKRLKHFKHFLKYYQELGGKTGLNLVRIKYKETEGIKIYLTEEELQIFQEADLKGIDSFTVKRSNKIETIYVNLEQVRDLFILQCNTGLRISDLQRLDKNITANRAKIRIQAKKTGVNLEIPITPAIRKILEKYNYQLPSIAEQKINDGIKQIYRRCFPKNKIQIRRGEEFETLETWTWISSHDAIRTFITLSAERGMEVSAISTITGKTIPVLLKHYLSQSQKFAEKQMEKAWGYSPLKIAR